MSVEFRPGGLRKVEYSEDGGNTWVEIAAMIESDTSISNEAIQNQGTYSPSQSGEKLTAEINFLDFTNYATMKALAVGSGKKQLLYRMTFDGNVRYKTTEPSYPTVLQQWRAARDEGDIAWQLQIEVNATEPYVFDPIA